VLKNYVTIHLGLPSITGPQLENIPWWDKIILRGGMRANISLGEKI